MQTRDLIAELQRLDPERKRVVLIEPYSYDECDTPIQLADKVTVANDGRQIIIIHAEK